MFFGVYHYSSASFTISRPSTHNLGLVGHWTFDGKNVVNGVALDSSGSGNNGNLGSIATSTFYSIGKIGQGFNFDGVDDYVNVGDIASTDGLSALTVSFWIKAPSSPTTQEIITDTNNVGLDGWAVELTANMNFSLRNTADGYISSYKSYAGNFNAWHFITMVYDGSLSGNSNRAKYYLDGIKQTFDTQTGTVPSSLNTNIGALIIGAANDLTLPLKGNLDDVRVYNRALSAGEVKNLYNQGVSKFNKTPTNAITNSLVGHWTFDGAKVVNGVALDSSGSGNNGNLGSIATSTFYSIGKIGQGFNFDGVDDYVIATDNASLSITGNLTISAWIKPVDATVMQSVVSKYDSAGNQRSYFMNISDTSISCNARELLLAVSSTLTPFTGAAKCSNAVLSSNKWSNVVAVYNASAQTVDLYIDGVNQTRATVSGTIPSSIADSSRNLSIGSSYSNSTTPNAKPFKGGIDDVRVYNRALSAGEIKMLYNMGR